MKFALKQVSQQTFWRLRNFTFGVLIAILASGDAHAQSSIADGIALVQAGRIAAARNLFTKLANAGEPHAMYHLGAMYHSGAGGPQDLEQAVYWYRKASDAGALEAKLALGSLFYKGKGVSKDLSKALRLFSEAANAGLLAAQYNLAMMHTAGLAHTKEYNADEDKPRAYKWFTVVLARLPPDNDRTAVQEGIDFRKQDMTPNEIARGQELAREWLTAHPAEGKTQ